MHSEIGTLLKIVERYFRAPMLFALLANFVDLSSHFYIICSHFKASNNITLPFLVFPVWLVIHGFEVLGTFEAVNSTVCHGNNTANILHRMIIEYYPTDVIYTVSVTIFKKFDFFSIRDTNFYSLCII